MILRTAFFQGAVRAGCERAFEDLLDRTLIPLWRRFPGAEEVRVLRPLSADAGAPGFALVLAIRYPDVASMEAALASSIREQTREPTNALRALFDGTVFHVTFDGDDHCPPVPMPQPSVAGPETQETSS